jgi:pilus assembly protein CpaF
MELAKVGGSGRPDERLRLPAEFAPLKPLLEDPAVTEIMVNGAAQVFVERDGRKQRAEAAFASEAALRAGVEKLFAAYGKPIGADAPYGDVCLADGTRVNAILAPIARFGMALTLRKFAQNLHTLDDLIRLGTLDRTVADLLVACIRGKVNILFSGGTSTGKTTLVQILSQHFDPRDRVITIEDAAELHLPQDNVISLETRVADADGRGEVSLRQLLRNALRMAPDRIVVGEVRGAEALDMVQAMATGHTGTLGVIHGSSPAEALMRLETMILMSGIALPLPEVRRMIGTTVQLIVHMERAPQGRLVTAVSELRGVAVEDNAFVLNDLFVRPHAGKPLEPVMHYYPRFYQRLKDLKLLGADALQASADLPGGAEGPCYAAAGGSAPRRGNRSSRSRHASATAPLTSTPLEACGMVLVVTTCPAPASTRPQ